MDKWDRRFLDMATYVSMWSKDPRTKCGAVIVRPDRTVASVGFNGFPKGVKDDEQLYADQETKLSRVVHAEVNAILHARESLDGYTLYTHPAGVGPTCDRCATVVITAGITRVVHYQGPTKVTSKWLVPAARAMLMYEEAGVQVSAYVS